MAKLIIERDSLYLIEKGAISKFIRSKKDKKYNINHHEVDNINLLNKSLNVRGYPKLQKILNQDSLKCVCNKSMGNTNLVYVKGAPKLWIMEIKNDSLQIRKIANIDSDPVDPVVTTEIIGYKWK